MEVCQLQGTLMISLHVASSRQTTVSQNGRGLGTSSVDGLERHLLLTLHSFSNFHFLSLL